MPDDIALAGHDGAAAAKLLERAQDEGAACLGDILYGVVERALSSSRARKRMGFTKRERQDLADALAATMATADLLGRARIRKRQQMAAQHEAFAEEFAEEYHGPESPGEGWVQSGTGPHGGKIWTKRSQDEPDGHEGAKPKLTRRAAWKAWKQSTETPRDLILSDSMGDDWPVQAKRLDDTHSLIVDAEGTIGIVTTAKLEKAHANHAKRKEKEAGYDQQVKKAENERYSKWMARAKVARARIDPKLAAGIPNVFKNGPVQDKILSGLLQISGHAKSEAEAQQIMDDLMYMEVIDKSWSGGKTTYSLHDAEKHAEVSAFTREPQHLVEYFSDRPTDFTCFDDNPIRPLQPLKALEWFRSLFPEIGAKQADWLKDIQKRAFSLAVTTEESVLRRVHDVIAEALEHGKAAKGPELIQEILDRAGVSPANPQYAEMVFRTNMMGAMNRGVQEELKEVADDFPVWRWDGISDGRQRHTHEVHFGCYFPSKVTFEEVRDSEKGEFDGHNDRCTPSPIWKRDWARLQAAGAKIKAGWDR